MVEQLQLEGDELLRRLAGQIGCCSSSRSSWPSLTGGAAVERAWSRCRVPLIYWGYESREEAYPTKSATPDNMSWSFRAQSFAFALHAAPKWDHNRRT